MKIRVIKKKLKDQKRYPLTPKEGRLFLKSLEYSTAIRNTVISGMISQGNLNGATALMFKFDKKYKYSGWGTTKTTNEEIFGIPATNPR